ncbi:MAG: glycosyltransferase [Cyanothece sp. SIO2G6]|nr:glycosyltransferase [Cyanothece sp. SIO2G6]
MSVPTVSVLLPVYNAEQYLDQALQSILNQTFTDFEVIAINDGSTDRSEAILSAYAQQDKRIKLISRPNAGLTPTLNEGLGVAQGQYIARMDSDDVAFPERFAKQVAFLEQHPDCVVVGCRVMLIDSEGLDITPFAQETEHDAIDNAMMSGQGGAICHPAAMMRCDAIRSIDGYRPELEPCEDRDLFLRLAEVGKLANLPDILLQYRMHPKSIGHSRRESQRLQGYRAVKDAHIRRGLKWEDPEVTDSPQRSVAELHEKWAWWALGSKNVGTARKHAMLSVRRQPLAASSWKVLLCAIRGY